MRTNKRNDAYIDFTIYMHVLYISISAVDVVELAVLLNLKQIHSPNMRVLRLCSWHAHCHVQARRVSPCLSWWRTRGFSTKFPAPCLLDKRNLRSEFASLKSAHDQSPLFQVGSFQILHWPIA